jgi:hypothetical protein
MKTRADALGYFHSHGLWAHSCDWCLGETVFVAGERIEGDGGVVRYESEAYLFPNGPGWSVLPPVGAAVDRGRIFALGDACIVAAGLVLSHRADQRRARATVA